MAVVAKIGFDLEANSAKFVAGLQRADRALSSSGARWNRRLSTLSRGFEQLNGTLSNVTKSMFSFSGALGVVLGGAGLVAITRNAIAAADSLGNVADRLGVNVETLQELRYAGELGGMAVNNFDVALRRFIRRSGEAAKGTGAAKDAFKELGISVVDANGRMRASEDLLADVADGLKRVEDPAHRLRLAFKFFDTDGAAMVNVLSKGSEGLARAREEARRLGLVLSEETVRNAQALNTEMQNLMAVTRMNVQQGLLRGLIGEMGSLRDIYTDPGFQRGLREFGHFIGTSIRFLVENADTVTKVVGALGGAWLGARVGRATGGRIGAVTGAAAGAAAGAYAAGLRTSEESEEQMGAATRAVQDYGDAWDETGEKVALATQRLMEQNQETADLINRYRDAPQTVRELRNELELENAARAQNIDLSTQQGKAWAATFREHQRLRDNLADVVRITTALETPQQRYNAEVQRLNELLVDGAINLETYTAAMKKAEEDLNATSRANEVAFEGWLRSVSDGFADAILQAESFSDVLRRLLMQLAKAELSNFLFGALTGKDAGGSIFGAIFGGFRARGGPMEAGKAYVVGERGPELVIPNVRSQVIPNDAIGDGGVVIHQTIAPQFAGNAATRQEVLEIAAMTQQATLAALPRQIRRGGAYAQTVRGR